MVGRVRTPMDEYQMAQERNKVKRKSTIRTLNSASTMPSKIPGDMTGRGDAVGKATRMPSDSPNVKKKIKGYSSEIM